MCRRPLGVRYTVVCECFYVETIQYTKLASTAKIYTTHFIFNLNSLYDRLNELPPSNQTYHFRYKILYSRKSNNINQLLIIESLYIKFNKAELNSGLKQAKNY